MDRRPLNVMFQPERLIGHFVRSLSGMPRPGRAKVHRCTLRRFQQKGRLEPCLVTFLSRRFWDVEYFLDFADDVFIFELPKQSATQFLRVRGTSFWFALAP